MRLDVRSPFQWGSINRMIQEKLGCAANVYAYRGLHQALFETSLALHLRFSHKRKLVCQMGLGDHLTSTEVELAKMGIRFKEEFEEEMAIEEKQTLAYIHDLDDPLTAELYDHIETLKKIAPTKMYRIHVAHHLFHHKKTFVKKPSDYDIIVCSLSPDYALVFTGEKIVLPTLTVGQLAWNQDIDGPKILNLIANDRKSFQAEINTFESDLPAGVKPWFSEQPAKRIYDRAAVILENHDSSALMEILAEDLKLEIAAPGYENPIESGSYCRWENQTWFDQAKKIGRTPEDMRGLLLIAGELLNPNFQTAFTKALQKLEQLSQ